ncbi:MAG TPA: hypothetical protein VK700_03735 [Steroidobacteraceae bacterium]|jgi:hypothetical protein|nr:hypothetical protein [Steroidobacteraceae bacterium]
MSRTAAVPMLFTLTRLSVAAVLVLVVIAYFLVALGMQEYQAIRPRGVTLQRR